LLVVAGFCEEACFPGAAEVTVRDPATGSPAQQSMSKTALGDRVLVAAADGKLGWSSVYLRWHTEELGMFPYIRITTAGGRNVR